MWMTLPLMLVAGTAAMTRNECSPDQYQNALRFFPEFTSYPVNIYDAMQALNAADDWQICEHDLMPRICVLDLLYGVIVNNFRSAHVFERDLRQIGQLARAMEAKCITRNAPVGKQNNL